MAVPPRPSWLTPIALAALVFIPAVPLPAHDIPNERVDRSTQVLIQPGTLSVFYEVSLAELTLIQDLKRLTGPIDAPDRDSLLRQYGEAVGPLNARGFLLSLDGRPLDLSLHSFEFKTEEHPVYSFHLVAPIPTQGRLRLFDTNYLDSLGTSRLALRAAPELTTEGYTGPASVEDVPIRPVWMLSDDQERQTRLVEITYSTAATPVPPTTAAATTATVTTVPAPRNDAPQKSPSRLTQLLDPSSRSSLASILLIAFGLGLVHAFQPGHGKTLIAAASLGEGGTVLRSALLAIVTSLAHTGTVMALAFILWRFQITSYTTIHSALFGVAGFLIAAVGLWRLGRHLAGHGEHAASNEFTTPHPSRLPLKRLLGLGFAGGLVPCWDAVLLLVLALAVGRIGLGLSLLVSFSLGMALLLAVVGVTAGHLRARFLSTTSARRGERILGTLSGLVLAAIGISMLWLS